MSIDSDVGGGRHGSRGAGKLRNRPDCLKKCFVPTLMRLRTRVPRRGSPKVTKDRGSKVRGVVRVGDWLCGVGERVPDDAR